MSIPLTKPAGDACLTCPARKAKCVHPEKAQGPARLAIVGESPSYADVADSRPFVGASGRLLMRGLRTLGLQRSDAHWTNAVLCEVKDADIVEARKCCAPRLQAELLAAAPPVVLTLGAFGLQSTIASAKKTPIQKWRGAIIEHTFKTSAASSGAPDAIGVTPSAGPSASRKLLAPRPRTKRAAKRGAVTTAVCSEQPLNRAVPSDPEPAVNTTAVVAPSGAPSGVRAFICPTLHPSFVLRHQGRKWVPTFAVDIDRVGRVLARGWFPPELERGRSIKIARTWDDLRAGLASLKTRDIGFDVETVGLGPMTTRLVCFALSDGMTTLVVPWSLRNNGLDPWWTNPPLAAQLCTDAMAGRVIVTHNGPNFDHIVAARYGLFNAHWLDDATWDDTLLMAHSYAGHLPKNLHHVVTQGLDVGPWKNQESRSAGLEELMCYNAKDTLYTVLRARQLREEMIAA